MKFPSTSEIRQYMVLEQVGIILNMLGGILFSISYIINNESIAWINSYLAKLLTFLDNILWSNIQWYFIIPLLAIYTTLFVIFILSVLYISRMHDPEVLFKSILKIQKTPWRIILTLLYYVTKIVSQYRIFVYAFIFLYVAYLFHSFFLFTKLLPMGSLGAFAISCFLLGNALLLKAASENDPLDAEEYYNKGLNLHKEGKYSMALQAYNRAIQLDPYGSTEAWYNKGKAYFNLGGYFNLGEYDKAVKCFDRAIKMNPQFADALCDRGIALRIQGKYSESLNDLDNAIKINPLYAKAWHYKGLTLKRLSRITEANSAFTKAKELGYKF